MRHRIRRWTWRSALLALTLPMEALGQGTPPPARPIPGINAEDRFPGACVDCHVRYPDQDLDVRFSTLLARWEQTVEPHLLVLAQASTRAGVTLEGRHPAPDPEVLANIPRSCIGCHTRRADSAPDLTRLVHRIHLQGGPDSVFLTVFQGECTHCHKLDPDRALWSIPSRPERAGGGG